jgi:hypothetical protein
MNLAFLAPGFLWTLLAIPLVIALHFLHNRRRQQTVSALFLWQAATEQVQVRRRFSPAWLLLLQLLSVLLLALALAQPVLTSAGRPDRVIIIDASASMAAVDSDGMRMDKARSTARELIRGGDRVALIRAGNDATVLVPPAARPEQLFAALDALQGADRTADLERALDLGRQLSENAELHLISDAPLQPDTRFVPHPVAGDGRNAGITTFDLGIEQAFIALTSSWPRPLTIPVELLRDGELIASAEVLVPAGGQGNATLPLGGATGMFEARIRPPAGDALDLDDSAFAGVRPLRVVFAGGSQALERALSAVPGVTLAAAGSGDVHVLVGADPAALPPGNHLLLAAPAEEPRFEAIRDWDQSDPLLRFVDLRDTRVGLDPDLAPVEDEGWHVLARSSSFRPVIRTRGSPGALTVQLAFHPNQTDLIYRPAFPTLIANLLEAFRGQPSLALGEPLPPGSTFEGEPASRALRPGIHLLPSGPVSASLLSAAETRIPGPSAGLPEEPPVQAPASAAALPAASTSGGRALAWWLLLLVPVLLAGEWFGWTRRAAGR